MGGSLSVTSMTATQARNHLFDLIRKALHGREEVRIQHRDGSVVLLAEEDYEALLESLDLASVPGLRETLAEAEEDVAAGRTRPLEAVLGDE
jgi:PHD/YefM family antitoxin component YafN of YafNO toxin-antitoxin module